MTIENACDTHFHIFGPYDRFPLSPDRVYTPAEASLADYREVQNALGFSRAVVVQPSIYGTDNRCTLDAVARLGGPDRARAVAVIDAGFSTKTLAHLHEQGVRGARINQHHGNDATADAVERLARQIAPLDWHLQIFPLRTFMRHQADVLDRVPVPVVIDHLGHIDPADGLNGAAFQSLLRLLQNGKTWIKLSGYLSSAEPAPYPDIAPFVRALADARPDRLLWGTNWPHPVPTPFRVSDRQLFAALQGWLADDALLAEVLVTNPQHLYGFDARD